MYWLNLIISIFLINLLAVITIAIQFSDQFLLSSYLYVKIVIAMIGIPIISLQYVQTKHFPMNLAGVFMVLYVLPIVLLYYYNGWQSTNDKVNDQVHPVGIDLVAWKILFYPFKNRIGHI